MDDRYVEATDGIRKECEVGVIVFQVRHAMYSLTCELYHAVVAQDDNKPSPAAKVPSHASGAAETVSPG